MGNTQHDTALLLWQFHEFIENHHTYWPLHLFQELWMKQLQLQEWKLQAALCPLQLYLDHKPAKENQ